MIPDYQLTPNWTEADKVRLPHDWRRHIPEKIRVMWASFDHKQRRAVIDWANDLADNEHWD